VRALQDTVARRLSSEDGIDGLIIDLSALAIADSFAAKVLGETADMARSLGARTVLVGLRPAVAITLVDLGIELPRAETALTLEAALAKLNLRIVRDE
jgi:rsbT antagonist protein RsbS